MKCTKCNAVKQMCSTIVGESGNTDTYKEAWLCTKCGNTIPKEGSINVV